MTVDQFHEQLMVHHREIARLSEKIAYQFDLIRYLCMDFTECHPEVNLDEDPVLNRGDASDAHL
jgi:hypothetical protein